MIQVLNTLAMLTTKLLDEKGSSSGTSKGGHDSSKAPASANEHAKETSDCLNPKCTKTFQGRTCQQVCTDCFDGIKSDRSSKISLSGSQGGTDHSGKSIYVTDSTNPKHRFRGGWKCLSKLSDCECSSNTNSLFHKRSRHRLTPIMTRPSVPVTPSSWVRVPALVVPPLATLTSSMGS